MMNIPEICRGYKYSRFISTGDGWGFVGCYCPPYKGKCLNEIEVCPKNPKISQ